MKLLGMFTSKRGQTKAFVNVRPTDSYQDSLNKLGKEQLKSLLERGIQLQSVNLAH
ncbi:MAG: hypothetical protein KBC63_02715 [Candidatus Levybacteria bacterium]|nr:hypothetical protein [Candidatus Levybacteria bacterium]